MRSLNGPPSDAPPIARVIVRVVILTIMAVVFSNWSRLNVWTEESCDGWVTVDARSPYQGIDHRASVAHVRVAFPAGMGFRDFPLTDGAEASLRGLIEAERARTPLAPGFRSTLRPGFTVPAIPRPTESVEVYCRLHYSGFGRQVFRVEGLNPPANAANDIRRLHL
ncbi:MAG: hypothetical protein NT029_17940 [Armatimonadetes bacterium]|nr:hypothetical protein [Armatimonadota bacterium]